MAQAHRLSDTILQDIVQRIVDVAQPERIILFGSAARGEMGPHSDVDVLVVKAGDYNPSQVVGDIYMRLYGVAFPYVHDIGELLILLEDVGHSVPDGIRQSARLRPWGLPRPSCAGQRNRYDWAQRQRSPA